MVSSVGGVVGGVLLVGVVVVVGSFALTRVSARFCVRLNAIFGFVGKMECSKGVVSMRFHRSLSVFRRLGNQGSYGMTSVRGGLEFSFVVTVAGSGIFSISCVRRVNGNCLFMSLISFRG